MTLTGDFVTGQTVPFARARKLLFDQGGGIQEGVVNAGDLMVTQRAASANMSVDVATGFAWVQIDTGTNNGLAHVTSDAVVNVAVTAAHATLPRIDQIILRYNDTAIPTGSGNTPTLEIVTGTATSGATLANRTGAAALPNDCLRVADVLVPAASSSVVNTNIRDRRPWSRGAYISIVRTAGSYSRTSSTFALVDATNLQPRIECSGTQMRLIMDADWFAATASKTMGVDVMLDGVVISRPRFDLGVVVSTSQRFAMAIDFTPSAGSHLIGLAFNSADNVTSVTLAAAAGEPLGMVVEEIVRQNTANNTVTSG